MPSPTPERPATVPAPMPAAHAPWRNAGATLIDSRGGIAAVALPDGRVLALGSRISCDYASAGAPIAEIWDPATNTWRETASLGRARTDFVMVALADGRVVVAGGLSAAQQSYSSTYLFDPSPGHETWSKAGLLGTARTKASAALLHDGRVLVMGGYYRSGARATVNTTADGAPAAYDPNDRTQVHPADMGPSPWGVPVLATAELFDPARGTWMPTGPMHAAEVGGPAVTLADGRVLVVGGSPEYQDSYNPYPPEIYDPRTGRFSVTGPLPIRAEEAEYVGVGSLVALADGGALLVGYSSSGHGPGFSLSLRYDARTDRWSAVGGRYQETWGENNQVTRSGVDRSEAMAAVLQNGRVLVAGGRVSASPFTSARAETFDPALNAFIPTASLPEPRSVGVALTLPDGSVLVVGNHGTKGFECSDPQRFATAIRYVPGP